MELQPEGSEPPPEAVVIVEYDPEWPRLFATVEEIMRRADASA